MVGKLRPGTENIDELRMLHSTKKRLWKSSERVALRLKRSNFDAVEHWRALATIPKNNPSAKVWETFSLFLESCSDDVFEKFFNKIQFTKVNLGEVLEILHKNNYSGEDIFAFFYNISTALSGKRNKNNNCATEKIRQELISDPNADLVEVGKYYNLAQGNKGNNFLTYSKLNDYFKNQ